MNNCIFCKIINGEIPCYKIYEDDFVLAFLDISNDLFGHTLVIPKKHCVNVLDCEDEMLWKIMSAIKKIMCHYKSLGFEGFNIINSNEVAGEQSVFHLHFHLYPRKQNDGAKIFPKIDLNNIPLEDVHKILKFKN